jgi:hypothetical protein
MIELRLCSTSDANVWPPSLTLEVADQISTIVHALATAGALSEKESRVAYNIDDFIYGREPYAARASVLGRGDVTALVNGPEALEWAEWVKRHINAEYKSSVEEMFGAEAVDYYVRMADALRAVFLSTRTHKRDLCVTSPAS